MSKNINSKKLKNINLVIGIIVGLSTTITFVLIGIPDSYQKISDWWANTLGEVGYKTKIIESLKAGATINYFKNKLGEPLVNEKIASSNYTQNIFVDKFYYVQALADDSGNVGFFSVTSRDKKFNPEFPILNAELQKSYFTSTGKEKFKDKNKNEFKKHDSIFNYYLGVHDYGYWESHWLGNPGNYKTYFVGLNQSGPPDYFNCSGINDGNCPWELSESDLEKFRTLNIINTYGESAPNFDVIERNLPVGVWYNSVRIFD